MFFFICDSLLTLVWFNVIVDYVFMIRVIKTVYMCVYIHVYIILNSDIDLALKINCLHSVKNLCKRKLTKVSNSYHQNIAMLCNDRWKKAWWVLMTSALEF